MFRHCASEIRSLCERRKKMAHVMTYLSKVNWKNDNRSPYQGVVKRNWVPSGRIDFATHLGNAEDADQPSDFKLLVEERRIVESIAGNENLEIQWRPATLKEAKAVVTQYHKYLSENSLIRSVFDDDTVAWLPPRKNLPKPSA
jgi:hypothetical protein